MMGVQAAARLFYEFCLDDHVPDDHQLRGIDRHLDLEDVRNLSGRTRNLFGKSINDSKRMIAVNCGAPNSRLASGQRRRRSKTKAFRSACPF